MEKTRFEMQGLPGWFTGWHDPSDRWNGFANPLLDRMESQRLAAAFNAQPGGGVRYSVAFSSEQDVFLVSFIEDDREEREGAVTARDVQGVGHVYDWGHGWCWLEEGTWS